MRSRVAIGCDLTLIIAMDAACCATESYPACLRPTNEGFSDTRATKPDPGHEGTIFCQTTRLKIYCPET